jgi:hypothetical protein
MFVLKAKNINRKVNEDRGTLLLPRGLLFALVLALFGVLVGCGGGGGTPSPGTATSVTGRVLRAETDQPVTGATVNIGGQSTTTITDGTFSLPSVNSATKTATVTPPSPGKPYTLTLALTAKSANNLGDIFTSDTGYTSSAIGTVVAPINGTQQAVGNATVTIAGSQVKTGTDGTFRIGNLAIGLGSDVNTPIGIISAPDFDSKPIFTQDIFVTGDNNLGTQILGAPVGKTPPNQPYTISGNVTSGGKAAVGVQVSIAPQGGISLGTVSTDASGNYFFWVVTGTYTVTATSGTATRSVTVTLAALDTPVSAPALAF